MKSQTLQKPIKLGKKFGDLDALGNSVDFTAIEPAETDTEEAN